MDKSLKTIRIRIGGMHCVHCETTVQKGLSALAGVQSVRVRYATGIAEVTCQVDAPSQEAIETCITGLGYTMLKGTEKTPPTLLRTAGILLLIVALYFVLSVTHILNRLAPGQLAQANMGYGMLFVIGLITSVHCVAMCGGINLSQCVNPNANALKTSKTASLKPAFLYNLGRVISYTVIGFLVGALGSAITFSPAVQGILKLAAGLFMVVMGVNMLGIFPWLRNLSPRVPAFIANRVNAEKWRSRNPLIVGLLNGFMPCGPLQAMQIYALSTGNPLAGALSMLVFSLGTVPLMFGLGALSSVLSRTFARRMLTVGAVLVVVLGLSMLSQGWTLAGVTLPAASAQKEKVVIADAAEPTRDNRSALASTATVTGVQVIESTLSASEYPNITVQAGTPVQWTIQAPKGSINGCNNRMYIPEYNIEHTFTQGDNLIEFTPTKAGTFPYSCWMGMINATITVVEAGTAAPVPTVAASGTAALPNASSAGDSTPNSTSPAINFTGTKQGSCCQ